VGGAFDVGIASACWIVPTSLQLFFWLANQPSMSELKTDSFIVLASGQMRLKNRHRELRRALFSAFIASSITQ